MRFWISAIFGLSWPSLRALKVSLLSMISVAPWCRTTATLRCSAGTPYLARVLTYRAAPTSLEFMSLISEAAVVISITTLCVTVGSGSWCAPGTSLAGSKLGTGRVSVVWVRVELMIPIEVAAIKDPMPEDGPCIFTGKAAIYYGAEDYFDDKKGHVLLKNQPLAVCDKTAGTLAALGRDDIFISESTFHYDGGGCC